MLEKSIIMEKISCFICGENEKNSTILSKDTFNVVECACGFKFINPRPDPKEISKFYNLDTYHPHQKGSGLIYFLFKMSRYLTYSWKMSLIKKYSSNNIVHLDYGGGDGSFSKYVRYFNIKSYSYDPIADKSNKTIDKDKKYNIVTLWHSLEHIHDLDNFFNTLDCIVNNGRIIVAVPNFNAFEKKYFKDAWAAYDIPRHLYHFDHITLEKLFYKKGYNLIDKRRMILDTIYISFLSRKIANIGYVKTLWIIILSIVKVLYNGPNSSSSLLYVFKKRH